MARRVGALLALVVAGIVVLRACSTSPLLVTVIAPGFAGEKRELTIRLVRILFPGAGLLVLSAWCLGVLNSHRRFFLSLRRAGGVEPRHHRARCWCWGRGGAWPTWRSPPRGARWPAACCRSWSSCRRCAAWLRGLRFRLATTTLHVRTVLRNFVPAF